VRIRGNYLGPQAQTARRAGLSARGLHPHAAASEERGSYASGLACLKTEGSHRIFKRPMRVHGLVYEKPFQELLGQVDNETTILMGHTRWRTRGNEVNNRNNHPIRAGIVIGAHNGTIYNVDQLFHSLGLPHRLRRGR